MDVLLETYSKRNPIVVLHNVYMDQNWWCMATRNAMAAILKIPQYVAYQKNVAYAFNSVESLTVLTFCTQWMCLAALLCLLVEIARFHSHHYFRDSLYDTYSCVRLVYRNGWPLIVWISFWYRNLWDEIKEFGVKKHRNTVHGHLLFSDELIEVIHISAIFAGAKVY